MLSLSSPASSTQVLPLSPRLDVVEKLERFLQLKAQSAQADQAKALLWRCAAEGRAVHPFGALSASEVRQAIASFDQKPDEREGRKPSWAALEGADGHSIGKSQADVVSKARPQVDTWLKWWPLQFSFDLKHEVKELALYLRSQTPKRRSNSQQLLRVAAERRWQVAGINGILTNDEVEKAILLGSKRAWLGVKEPYEFVQKAYEGILENPEGRTEADLAQVPQSRARWSVLMI
eukprot:g28819.t1